MHPTFLLHVCCAPCSIAILDELKDKYDVTVFFYNPNIYPEEEYVKRKGEVLKICKEWNLPIIDMDYEAAQWHEAIQGLEADLEGGPRCTMCFRFRLAKAADYAAQHKFKYFATSLTSGRNKSAEVIHPIGFALAKYYGIRFYDTDWKKGGRQEKAARMIKERGIYRQNYCGCEFSMKRGRSE